MQLQHHALHYSACKVFDFATLLATVELVDYWWAPRLTLTSYTVSCRRRPLHLVCHGLGCLPGR